MTIRVNYNNLKAQRKDIIKVIKVLNNVESEIIDVTNLPRRYRSNKDGENDSMQAFYAQVAAIADRMVAKLSPMKTGLDDNIYRLLTVSQKFEAADRQPVFNAANLLASLPYLPPVGKKLLDAFAHGHLSKKELYIEINHEWKEIYHYNNHTKLPANFISFGQILKNLFPEDYAKTEYDDFIVVDKIEAPISEETSSGTSNETNTVPDTQLSQTVKDKQTEISGNTNIPDPKHDVIDLPEFKETGMESEPIGEESQNLEGNNQTNVPNPQHDSIVLPKFEDTETESDSILEKTQTGEDINEANSPNPQYDSIDLPESEEAGTENIISEKAKSDFIIEPEPAAETDFTIEPEPAAETDFTIEPEPAAGSEVSFDLDNTVINTSDSNKITLDVSTSQADRFYVEVLDKDGNPVEINDQWAGTVTKREYNKDDFYAADGTQPKSLYTDEETKWQSISLNLPKNAEAGEYTVRVTAVNDSDPALNSEWTRKIDVVNSPEGSAAEIVKTQDVPLSADIDSVSETQAHQDHVSQIVNDSAYLRELIDTNNNSWDGISMSSLSSSNAKAIVDKAVNGYSDLTTGVKQGILHLMETEGISATEAANVIKQNSVNYRGSDYLLDWNYCNEVISELGVESDYEARAAANAQKFVETAQSYTGLNLKGEKGIPDDSWCGYFTQFVGKEAGMGDIFTSQSNSANGKVLMQNILAKGGDAYYFYDDMQADLAGKALKTTKDSFTPQIGDIVVVRSYSNATTSNVNYCYSHVAIVSGYDKKTGSISVVHGNWSGQVTNGTTFSTTGRVEHGGIYYEISGYARPAYGTK